jgi:N-hydroxyarylamine O-acetyltransferase
MKLAQYLDRIGFRAEPRVDLATLRALHRAHQFAVPFENLDVQLRRPLTPDVEAAYEKIVRRRRGGWCYEMNGLFGWVLAQIGFDVTRMSAGVMRERAGDVQLGNHLCLLVQLEQPYLVDVGFGGSLLEPLPLRVVEREDRPYRLALGEVEGGYWRFTELAHSAPFTFDFRARAADEELLNSKCQSLQIDPASPFVQNLVVQRRAGDAHISLRGRVVTTTHGTHAERVTLNSADELLAALRTFEIDEPQAATLWLAICERHEVFFGGSM